MEEMDMIDHRPEVEVVIEEVVIMETMTAMKEEAEVEVEMVDTMIAMDHHRRHGIAEIEEEEIEEVVTEIEIEIVVTETETAGLMDPLVEEEVLMVVVVVVQAVVG